MGTCPEKRPNGLVAEVSMDEAVVAGLVEKYDIESRFRRLPGWQGRAVTALLAAMTLFHLYSAGFATLPVVFQRAVHLTFAITAVFILYPAAARSSKTSVPWFDWILAVSGALIIGYIAVF